MGVAFLILLKNGRDLLREIWLPIVQWNSGTISPMSNTTKSIPVDPESQQIPKNPEPPLTNVEFYEAEVLVTQGFQEVPEPLTATKVRNIWFLSPLVLSK